MQNKSRKISAVINVSVTLALIAGISAASVYKLAQYYVNDVEYNNATSTAGNRFENDVATTFAFKNEFIDLNGGMRRLYGAREMNGVVRLNNGALCTPYRGVSDELLRKQADTIIALKEYCDKRGTVFVYGIPPYNSSKYDPQFPAGYNDYGNINFDKFAEMLSEGGVEIIDFRETMHDEGIDQYDMMYKTDHHWNSEAGYYAYTKITDYLEDKLGCTVDPVVKDINNYTMVNYPESHLGSRGKRVGRFFGGIDDFHIYWPNFETSLKRGNQTGTFESLIVNMSAIEENDLMKQSTYDVTLGNSRSSYTNPLAQNDTKLLVMADSFGSVVNPFLILSYAETSCLKVGLTADYIEKFDPDAIVMFFYATCFIEEDCFEIELPTSTKPLDLPKINVTLKREGTSADITWDAVENAKEYKVYSFLGDECTLHAKIKETEYTVTGLDGSKDYGFLVVAINGDDLKSEFDRKKDVVYVKK